MAIITIFSGTHCHGEDVTRRVVDALGLEQVDDKVLEEASKRFDLPKEKLLRAMTGPAPFWNNFTHEREKNIACLKVALAELLQDDGKLIHGYLGHLLATNISHVLRVCIIANFPYRIEQAMRLAGTSEKEATKLLHADDEERLQWTQYLFEKTPYHESLYDLVVPMQEKSVEQAAELVVETARSQPLQMTPLSELAARDFLLAARVNLALTRANHDVDVTAKHGEVTILIKRHAMRMKAYQEELIDIAKTVTGVSEVQAQLGPKYHAPAINPMANIELPPKVLLVDDEKAFVETLSERLQTRQLPASVVYDGQQALDYVERDQPDVMVLDLMMPGIGGIEVLRRLKQTHPNIEVIVLTGHGSEKEEQLAADLGAFAYLQKPVNIDVLAEVMRDAYRRVNKAKASAQKAQSEKP